MPGVANPVYMTMVNSIQAVARDHHVRLLLHSTDGDAADELALLRDLKQRYVDGLILCSLRFTDAHVAALARAAVPVAVIGRPPKEARVDTVLANSRRGAVEAVRHLYDVGRRRIAFINGPEATTPGRARRLGYLDGLRACGLERDDVLVEVAEDFLVEPGARATARLLERARPDAIFCANDLLALGAVNSLRAAELDVPRDVAVVGMDDSSIAAFAWPPLTSVDLGSAERGRLAADLLLKRIDRPNRRPRTIRVEPRLVVRDSSEVVA
jgi:LacI family transcriptional regulator